MDADDLNWVTYTGNTVSWKFSLLISNSLDVGKLSLFSGMYSDALMHR